MPRRRIPLPPAEAELAERIRLGQHLLTEVGRGSVHGPQQEAAWDEAVRWHDHNSAWLGNHLRTLADRLRGAGCDVDLGGTGWLDPSRFPDRGSHDR